MALIRWKILAPLLALALVAAACADPDLGPPSSTTLPVATPTPTPEPEPDPALGPSNTTTTTVLDLGIDATPTPTPVPPPEPGLSDTVLRVGVIADVSTGALADDRGEAAWSAVAAWARAVNDAGGLAGRQVVVQQIDSAVFSHDDALREACAEVFALVGSWSVNDGDGLDVLLSPDCSLPDFPAEARTPARRLSPVTYQSNPLRADQAQGGQAQLLAERSPEAAAAASVPILDFEPARVAGERLIEAYTLSGFGIVERPTVGLEDDLVALAAAIADDEIASLVWRADAARLGRLLTELDVLGARPEVIDCGQACYNRQFVDSVGAALLEGVTVSLSTVPLEEVDTSFELTRYLFWLGRTRPDAVPDPVGVQAWAAALLFEEAVRRATEGNVDLDSAMLTRSAVLDAAETITSWDAGGLQGGEADPGAGVGSPCFVSLTFIDGSWQRNHPFGRGLFDCESDNLITLETTADLGLGQPGADLGGGGAAPSVSPTPVPEAPG